MILIALNVIAFIQTPGQLESPLQPGVDTSIYFIEEGPIPCQLEDACAATVPGTNVPIPDRTFTSFLWASLFSTFLHAGLLHIAGNMLFLWVFGNNVEDYLGRVKFAAFYLLGGIAASFAHALVDLGSQIPSVGASGAVAAVMGAYLVLFPKARVNVLVPLFILWTVIQLSAFIVLGLWFAYQFLIGQQQTGLTGGVAWMAHVGGFVYGAVVIFLLGGRPHKPQTAWEPTWGRY